MEKVEFNLNNIVNSLKYVANTLKNKENELRKAQDTEVFANQIKPALVAEMKNNLGLQPVNYVVGNQEKDLLRILGDSVNEGNMNRTISSVFEENFVNNVLTNTTGISTKEKESLINTFETLYQNSGNQNDFVAKCVEQSCDIATYMFKAHKDDIVKENYTAMLEKITDSINNYPVQHRDAIKREIEEMLQRGDKLPDTLRERLENMTNDNPRYVGPDDQRENLFSILS